MSERITFICPEPLLLAINSRGKVSDGIRESLSRYFHLLGQARKSLRGRFTPDELELLCKALSGKEFTASDLALRGIKIEGGGPALLAKLRDLSLVESAALVDAIERYGRASSTGISVDPRKILE